MPRNRFDGRVVFLRLFCGIVHHLPCDIAPVRQGGVVKVLRKFCKEIRVLVGLPPDHDTIKTGDLRQDSFTGRQSAIENNAQSRIAGFDGKSAVIIQWRLLPVLFR